MKNQFDPNPFVDKLLESGDPESADALIRLLIFAEYVGINNDNPTTNNRLYTILREIWPQTEDAITQRIADLESLQLMVSEGFVSKDASGAVAQSQSHTATAAVDDTADDSGDEGQLNTAGLIALVMDSDRDTEVRGSALFTLLAEAERIVESESALIGGAMLFDAKRSAAAYLGSKIHENAFQQLRTEFARTGDLTV
jgi:hypothetical protein